MKKKYIGTDGREYRGREIRARLWLEARQKDYDRIIGNTQEPQAYSRPGSMKCRR